MTKCFICGDPNENAIQTHHIVPNRHGGSDKDENLVDLCANCHQAIERVYDKRFYQALGVEQNEHLEEWANYLEDYAEEQRSICKSDHGWFPPTHPNGTIDSERMARWGIGEDLGYKAGMYDMAMIMAEKFREIDEGTLSEPPWPDDENEGDDEEESVKESAEATESLD
jgi:hypothetical protein